MRKLNEKSVGKDWYEKMEQYEDRYKANRQVRDIWKYIPQKKKECVTNAFSDSDGYWIWLDEEHVAYDGGEDCGIIHEFTIVDLKDAIKTIRKGEKVRV